MIFIITVSIGCNSKIPYGGKVTFEDGTPLTKGTVVFTTPTYQAEGFIRKDGSYHLGSLKPGDGLPEGVYTVFVNGAVEYKGDLAVPLVDPQYTERTSSPLSCHVSRKGPKMYDFQVKKP